MQFETYTTLTEQAVQELFEVTPKGLTTEQVSKLEATYGANELEAHPVTMWDVLFRQLRSPFIYILFAAALLSYGLGEYIDGSMIIAFLLINTILGFVQEYQSEHSLELLKKFVVKKSRVIRDGNELLIDSRTIVPGDRIQVETGDIIPADIRFIETTNLSVDESGLSGESVSIPKISSALAQPVHQVHDARNIGFAGSKIVGGEGVGIVIAIGRTTVMGDVAKLTVETKRDGLFEKGIASFSSFILKMIVAIIVLVFVINLAIKGGSVSVSELVLFSIALAVSVIPEALPVIITLSLSRGALKLAKNRVVVKRLSAIEDLGSIDVLCTDKTGTLTENKLEVSAVYGTDSAGILTSALAAASFIGDGTPEPNNSFDLAVWNHVDASTRTLSASVKRLAEIPFDPDRKRNSALVVLGNNTELVVRGAPEAVIKACPSLDENIVATLLDWVRKEGMDGKRVIAVASKVFSHGTYTIADEIELTFLGMISFVDPIKSTTKDAIQKAHALGLTVKIITGDGPEVAAAVAHEVGIISDTAHVITGDALDALSPEQQAGAVLSHDVFARVSPRQKYHIIELLKLSRRVGFLGEGINDAPALKVANVALVVAGASDIARDAADIVLLDPSLNVIVDAIEDGREIFQNTVKYLKITLISNFGNFFSLATASLISSFLPMLPIQLLLLNILTDFPLVAIATDSVDTDVVSRPETYNFQEVIAMALILGLISTTFDFVFFGYFYHEGAAVLQTNWFIGSALTELVLLFSIRTKGFWLKAKAISWQLAVLTVPAATIAVVLPFTHFGQSFFHFLRPESKYIIATLVIVLGYFIASEIGKLLFYRWYPLVRIAKK
jgi:Mg2+-importing ATPase